MHLYDLRGDVLLYFALFVVVVVSLLLFCFLLLLLFCFTRFVLVKGEPNQEYEDSMTVHDLTDAFLCIALF